MRRLWTRDIEFDQRKIKTRLDRIEFDHELIRRISEASLCSRSTLNDMEIGDGKAIPGYEKSRSVCEDGLGEPFDFQFKNCAICFLKKLVPGLVCLGAAESADRLTKK